MEQRKHAEGRGCSVIGKASLEQQKRTEGPGCSVIDFSRWDHLCVSDSDDANVAEEEKDKWVDSVEAEEEEQENSSYVLEEECSEYLVEGSDAPSEEKIEDENGEGDAEMGGEDNPDPMGTTFSEDSSENRKMFITDLDESNRFTAMAFREIAQSLVARFARIVRIDSRESGDSEIRVIQANRPDAI